MTAVELLKQDIDLEIKSGTKMVVNWDMYLEMEKQQIKDAWFDGYGGSAHSEDEYYNETYGSKGSDDCQFEQTTNTSSATICKHCGREKFLHKQ